MVEKYCPKYFKEDFRWDPILGQWGYEVVTKPAHLFPWSEKVFMNEIFGAEKGEINEVFTPHNGLFTNPKIKEALDKGYIAIVPDIDLEPIDHWQPFNNAECGKAKAWEDRSVKDYKIIVIDKQHAERGDLNARHVQHELRKYTRYWGTGGKYVKKSQLLGLVQELGPDVGSFLTEGLGKPEGEKPTFEAVHALVEAVAVKSVKDNNEFLEDNDPNDSDGSELYEQGLYLFD
ncbi:unnamed protein product [Fusarium venenatum]|uniref:HNH nuclease domain-containing protein n=1 Tax=Fusarium venenatum TaxID=56646 RepID=A0A2L2TFM6_9HYPO|nr:uncharacterized protein FVRRES_07653 [Fusarium venenatum]CEI63217.1 unnamed protein product [Fusarium venenatum]